MKPLVSLLPPAAPGAAPLYRLSTATMQVTVSALGACLRSILLADGRGGWDEVTQGPDDEAGWLDNAPYFGVTVGRVANRLAEARFTVEGTEHRLAANDGVHHLHGGRLGFSRQGWTVAEAGTETEAGLELGLVSPDGQDGYPGRLDVKLRISLNDRNVIKFVFAATSDRSTPVNLTNHAYFNLGGTGQDSVLDHVFWSGAGLYLPVGPGQIPTGEVRPVTDGPFDFRVPKALGRDYHRVEGGYDHCLVLDARNRALGSVREAARVSHGPSGRTLKLYTDQSGFQLYTGNYLGGVVGRGGRVLRPASAFCLESQRFPDAVDRPGWDSVVLRPGETYRHEFHYAFEFEGATAVG